ncbi:MAG: hypothetical protein K8F60_19010, partial [Melioribacteraceae bacterium]|nr:hypothetical protein [Melioribacteraceae bacterium]
MKKLFMILAILILSIAIQATSFSYSYEGPSTRTIPFGSNSTSILLNFSYEGTQGLFRPKIIIAVDHNIITNDLCTGEQSFLPNQYNLVLTEGVHDVQISLLSINPNTLDCYDPIVHQVENETFTIYFKIKIQNNFEGGEIFVDDMVSAKTSPNYRTATNGTVVPIKAKEQTYENYPRVWNQSGTNNSYWQSQKTNFPPAPFSSYLQTSYTTTINDKNTVIQANLRKNFRIQRDDQPEFAVLQSNQSTSYIVEQNSGQITAPSSRNINNITYGFAGWTDDFTQSASRTISPDDNETYTALYKYKNHSNNTNGFAGNGQKKVARRNNELFKVYESMNKLWLESSSDNGVTWSIKNGGKPIVAADAKHPSVAFEDGTWRMFMVYQQGESIRLAFIDASLSTNNLQADVEVLNSNNGIE